jgi:hypothetical protein
VDAKQQSVPVAERLLAWADDVQLSNRLGFPHYENPGELKADIRSLVEQLEALRAALEFYADEKTWTQPTSWDGRIVDDEGPWLSDTGQRAREVLYPAKEPS